MTLKILHTIRRLSQRFHFIIGASIILTYFTSIYIIRGHSNLPIGWDTPYYLGQVTVFWQEGIYSLIKNIEYNFGYHILISVLAILGAPPLLLEIVIPPALCLIVVKVLGHATKLGTQDIDVVAYTALFSASWFGLYRLGADLHSNLLSLAIILFTLRYVLPNPDGLDRLHNVLPFSLLLFVSSLVHFETTAFFSIVICLAMFVDSTMRSPSSMAKVFRRVLIIGLCLTPSILLYVNHITNLLVVTGSPFIAKTPMGLIEIVTFIGIAIPIVILWIIISSYKLITAIRTHLNQQFYWTLVYIWSILSVFIFSIHYAYPRLASLSERSLQLFPSALILPVGVEQAFLSLQSVTRRKGRILKSGSAPVFIFILAVSCAFTLNKASQVSQVYISRSAYNKLQWLATEFRPAVPPIFIFNDYDAWAGGMGNLYDNWVQAVYGKHYSYLGNIEFLVSKSETPFSDPVSKYVSAVFINRMQNDGIFWDIMFSHDIVMIDDFYKPSDTPDYFLNYFNVIEEGIFVFNASQYMILGSIYIPAYTNLRSSSGHWYSIEKSWTMSKYSLELWDPLSIGIKQCEFYIPVEIKANYMIRLRYWDGEGNDILLRFDAVDLSTISYNATHSPREVQLNLGSVSPGIHRLEALIENSSYHEQYLSLDFIELIRY